MPSVWQLFVFAHTRFRYFDVSHQEATTRIVARSSKPKTAERRVKRLRRGQCRPCHTLLIDSWRVVWRISLALAVQTQDFGLGF